MVIRGRGETYVYNLKVNGFLIFVWNDTLDKVYTMFDHVDERTYSMDIVGKFQMLHCERIPSDIAL